MSFGDAHIYLNHLTQVRTQLSRVGWDAPKLWLNPEVENIESFTFDDIRVVGYQHDPAIAAAVSV